VSLYSANSVCVSDFQNILLFYLCCKKLSGGYWDVGVVVWDEVQTCI